MHFLSLTLNIRELGGVLVKCQQQLGSCWEAGQDQGGVWAWVWWLTAPQVHLFVGNEKSFHSNCMNCFEETCWRPLWCRWFGCGENPVGWAPQVYESSYPGCQSWEVRINALSPPPPPHLYSTEKLQCYFKLMCSRSYVFELFVEKERILINIDLAESISSLLHSVFCFNLKYPKVSECSKCSTKLLTNFCEVLTLFCSRRGWIDHTFTK